MIHVTKDKVLITNMIVLNKDENCVTFEKGTTVPCEITNNLFLSNNSKLGKILSKMTQRTTIFQRLKLSFNYIFLNY